MASSWETEMELADAFGDGEAEFESEFESAGEAAEAYRPGPAAIRRPARPYGAGSTGISTGQISNGAGRTAQVKFDGAAVSLAEFNDALGKVQRDVQASASMVRKLRTDVDRHHKAIRASRRQEVAGARLNLLNIVLEQVKDFVADVSMNKALNPQPPTTSAGAQTAQEAARLPSPAPAQPGVQGATPTNAQSGGQAPANPNP